METLTELRQQQVEDALRLLESLQDSKLLLPVMAEIDAAFAAMVRVQNHLDS